jgi:hypothetical protein
MDEQTMGEQVAVEMNPLGAQISSPADLPPLPEVTTRRAPASTLPEPVTLPPEMEALVEAHRILVGRGLVRTWAESQAAWAALSELQEKGASNVQLVEKAREIEKLSDLTKEARPDG